jgi:tRNA(fMet)-specific endonuclease VapC
MPYVVVDTCVLSALFKGSPLAASYGPHIAGKRLVISFITLGELYRWPLVRGWGDTRRKNLEAFIYRRCVLYPFSPALCQIWAEATYQASQNGYTVPVADSWIAAMALLYEIPLVTNNPSDYEGIPGLNVVTETV